MKKSAAYMVNDTILLQAMSLTDSGLWIAYGVVFSIRVDDPVKLTDGIRRSLANDKEYSTIAPMAGWLYFAGN
ncbi:hypothetical protein [Rhizobium tumorigenes]|uniref:Uncharacterized protein n=1 Tax=Rhizobium tumorigenes TaxID=2041385 RepID=A0AAF1K9H9_9HYPH|nr:hypothetical protein [Rhizobium tumorigenes]WFR98773.1 hypothetical protein PR017_24045 [Rhizobium tumorigenes]